MKRLFRGILAAGAWLLILASPTVGRMPDDPELIDVTDYEVIRSRRPLLIAHRGGVIGPGTPECSLAAIELAAEHGYDMVELDVQEASDGQPVVFHDRGLRTACGVDGAIRQLTAERATQIRYLASDQHIATLDEALALCRSLRLGVMLDVKTFPEAPGSGGFFRSIAELVAHHELTHAAVTITWDPVARDFLTGVALLVVTREDFARVTSGQSVDLRGQFWFDAARELPVEAVRPLQESGAFVVPAINTFLYPSHAHRELAAEDVKRLTAAGVDGFQIDSTYEDLIEAK